MINDPPPPNAVADSFISVDTSCPTPPLDRKRTLRVLRWAGVLAPALVLGLSLALAWGAGSDPVVPLGIVRTGGIAYKTVPGRTLLLDVLEPADSGDSGAGRVARPAIVAIHGGGWRGGSRMEFAPWLYPLVHAGYVVIVVDYRLSKPNQPCWPDNLEDVQDAVLFVRDHADSLGVDPKRIALIGASAGAHLALLATVAESEYPRDAVGDIIQAVAAFYGPTDLERLYEDSPGARNSLHLFLGRGPDTPSERERYRAASPAFHLARAQSRARAAGRTLPPVFLIHGDDDLMIPPSQSLEYADALRAAGVTTKVRIEPGLRHGFGLNYRDVNFLPDILAFFNAVWQNR